MNARVKVPTTPMTAVEPARHNRLGGGGSSAIRRSIEEEKNGNDRIFSLSAFIEVCRRLNFRRDIRSPNLDFMGIGQHDPHFLCTECLIVSQAS